MNKKQFSPILICLLGSLIFMNACKKCDDPKNTDAYESGVFVMNEGPFQNGTGTISFFNRTDKTVKQDIFSAVNNRPLGTIVQSMTIFKNKGYIVVNKAGKIEVVNPSTFVSTGVINEIVSPRYLLGVSDTKAYVSDWNDNAVKVVDLTTLTVTSSITTGAGPDKMVMVGDKVYVINSGGFTNANTITVISATSDNVLSTVTVGDNPNSIIADGAGNIWILAGGISDWTNPTNNTAGTLVKYNTTTQSIETTLTFPSVDYHPFNLITNTNGTELYYTYENKVCKISSGATSFNAAAIVNRNFYSLGFDPVGGHIFASDAGDFSSDGYVFRYLPSGALVDSFKVGIIPGNFSFK